MDSGNQYLAIHSSKIIFFISDIESVEGFFRISVMLFHEFMQKLVIEFIPYVTLLGQGMYNGVELL